MSSKRNRQNGYADSDFEFAAWCIIFVTIATLIWLVWDYVTTVKL